MQLVRSIFSLQHFYQAKQMEFLLKSVQPLISLEGLFSLLEDRWFSVKEIFEVVKLIWFCRCFTTDSLPQGYPGQLFELQRIVELDGYAKRLTIYTGSGPRLGRVITLRPVWR